MRIPTAAALLLLYSSNVESFTFAPKQNSGYASATSGLVNKDQASGCVSSSSKLYSAQEDLLRKVIASRNADVADEAKYGVVDAEGLADADDGLDVTVDDTSTTVATVSSPAGSSEQPVTEEEVETEPEEASASVATATLPEDSLQQTPQHDGSSPKSSLREKINRATKPRAYPLFLAEIAANVLDDAVKSVTGSAGVEDAADTKEKIVVLGTGWGAAAFLKGIDVNKFDVTVVSPRNFFLFTPMLAGCSIGTVEYRSITEPVREINSKVKYLEATAIGIDPETSKVSCEAVVCEGNSCTIEDFTVDYDRVILTVGAQTNTFGIPGVREHCCFLKQVEDAQRIRTAVVNCFERANLPFLTDEERIATLTFAVIGAGPTGIEFASELRDFVEQDGPKYYPNLLKYVRIKVIEASSTVLAPFDKSLQDEAIKQLTRTVAVKDPEIANLLPEEFKLTELLLDSGVSEVKENVVCLNNGKEIPFGVAVWAAGNGPLPITLQLIDALSENNGGEGEQADAQSVARGRVAVDPWLRALGGQGKILALGDCSCIVDNQLPATAQVASQQGEYLARLLCQNYDLSPGSDAGEGISLLPPARDGTKDRTLAESISAFAIQNGDIAAPFQFLNLGILAYTGGGSALAQLQVAPDEKARVKGKGKIGFGLWRSVYLSKQVSWRNRFLVFVDWTKARLFGRDITRI